MGGGSGYVVRGGTWGILSAHALTGFRRVSVAVYSTLEQCTLSMGFNVRIGDFSLKSILLLAFLSQISLTRANSLDHGISIESSLEQGSFEVTEMAVGDDTERFSQPPARKLPSVHPPAPVPRFAGPPAPVVGPPLAAPVAAPLAAPPAKLPQLPTVIVQAPAPSPIQVQPRDSYNTIEKRGSVSDEIDTKKLTSAQEPQAAREQFKQTTEDVSVVLSSAGSSAKTQSLFTGL